MRRKIVKNGVTKDFTVYDYLSVDVELEHEQLYVDCYQNFGWLFISSSNVLNQDYYQHNIYNDISFINCSTN